VRNWSFCPEQIGIEAEYSHKKLMNTYQSMKRATHRPCRAACRLVAGAVLLLLAVLLSSCSASGPAWQGLGPNGQAIISLSFGPNDTSALFAGTNGQGLFRSLNSGQNWSADTTGLPAGLTVSSIVADSSQNLLEYLGTDAGVFQSSDEGDHWQKSSQGLPTGADGAVTALLLNPDDPMTLYAGTAHQGVSISHDGAKTWSASGQGLPAGATVHALLAEGHNQGLHLYAALAGAGVYRSDDGGQSWVSSSDGLPAGVDVLSLLWQPSNPGGLYAGTSAGIYRSTDGGTSWRAVNTGLGQTPPQIFALALNDQSPLFLFAGTSTGVYRSADGGATWGLLAAGLPSGQSVLALVVVGNKASLGTVFVAAGGIYRYPSQQASVGGQIVEFVVIAILVVLFLLLFYQQRRMMQRLLPAPPTRRGQRGPVRSSQPGPSPLAQPQGEKVPTSQSPPSEQTDVAQTDEPGVNGAGPKKPS
jgi:hypothetical protein